MPVVVRICIHDYERRLSAIENEVLSVIGLCRQLNEDALSAALARGFNVRVSPRSPNSIHSLTMEQFGVSPSNSYGNLPLSGGQSHLA